jgi:ABC-type antimicrobial peptide transport system permease subunit
LAGFALLSLITLFIGMFLVYSTMTVAVAKRRAEINVLRALGVRRRQIARRGRAAARRRRFPTRGTPGS